MGYVDAAGRPFPAVTGRRTRTRCTLLLTGLGLWHGRIRPHAKRVTAPDHRHLTIPLAALTVVSTTATVLAPVLARWPLVLALLSPRLPFLLLAAHSSPLVVFLVLGTARACLADPFSYLLGRRLAGEGARRGPITRVFDRFGTQAAFVAVLVRPIGRHLFAAGAVRARPLTVAIADVIGTVAFLWILQTGVSVVL